MSARAKSSFAGVQVCALAVYIFNLSSEHAMPRFVNTHSSIAFYDLLEPSIAAISKCLVFAHFWSDFDEKFMTGVKLQIFCNKHIFSLNMTKL